MRTAILRRLVLLSLALVVAIACVVPGVFHDDWWQSSTRYRRNRMTGDVTIVSQGLGSWNCLRWLGGAGNRTLFDRPSVFRD